MAPTTRPTKPFTAADVADRALVIAMLEHEERLAKSPEGQDRYRNPLNDPDRTLTVEKGFHRDTLAAFGFATDDDSVAAYRTIFRTYFRSVDDYDAGVIGASYYMRNNRCVFYTAPPLELGAVIPDAPLRTLADERTTLYDQLVPGAAMLVCAFSES